jgi:pyruvate kinase
MGVYPRKSENQKTMNIHESSKTKIIATLGPSCAAENKLLGLIYSGIDICRINFSHGRYEEYEEMIRRIRDINTKLGTNIAILADLQGPKIRLGEVEEGVVLEDGASVIFSTKECTGTREKVFISYENLPADARKGDIILIDDGKLKLKVEKTNGKDQIVARVVYGGPLKSRKGVNLPHTRISIPSLTAKDKKDVEFILDHDLEWVGLSFVRWAQDIKDLKSLIQNRHKKTLVVAKIEKPEALEELDRIIEMTDAVMVARGDLGVEVSYEKVPLIQKMIVRKCINKQTPVIIATQMLESMITNFRPTRAEANDVANAVFDSSDAVMLSGETSVGKFPVESIQCMQRIIDYAESSEFVQSYEHLPSAGSADYIPDSACFNACRMADQSGAQAIIAFAENPQTAFRLACNRPKAPVFIFTSDPVIIRQLSLVWGVRAFYIESGQDIDDAFDYSVKSLKEKKLIRNGDAIVLVSSIPLFDSRGVDTIKLCYV